MTRPSTPLRRVRVVGTTGSGKTTFARRLAGVLGVPHVELDEVFWGPGWVKRDPDEALADVRARTAGPGWVTDGNWDSRLGGALDTTDTVVWLDYPRRVVMGRVVRRTLWRGITRRELWHGNRERLSSLLSSDPHQNVVLWAWRTHGSRATQYAALVDAPDCHVVRLRSPREAERWVRAVAAARTRH
ncbi:putative adenylate kinase [Cellulomonas flavigena DSM 20109]|uniref:Putative adenylate kinase n=1 Tax=Cellulomonas flavigena (strain ATCC 482 / DSM 20109 / BCRC 11376 / JCM 18109 / NBRC 3775 / NCIMB 8073 / NRS 134) TaxID=446466 RepID=D5UCF4_CELFN|nr:toxin [Cellulomonas flavigena]ADG74268.1 putative adenylate kinase [Cellulomonas flavigena DSM 20109]